MQVPLKFFFKFRGLLMVPPMIFLALCDWWETENELVVFGLGGLLFAMGLALRIWSQMHLHYRLHVKKVLTTAGPYQHIRNPIYVANAMMLTASCFLAELFWFAPVMLAYAIAIYSLTIRYEESHLRAKYGASYAEYTGRVPRWLPRSWKLKHQYSPARNYFWPSMLAELHNLLLLTPFMIKEVVL